MELIYNVSLFDWKILRQNFEIKFLFKEFYPRIILITLLFGRFHFQISYLPIPGQEKVLKGSHDRVKASPKDSEIQNSEYEYQIFFVTYTVANIRTWNWESMEANKSK
jgi:hypothetical protein